MSVSEAGSHGLRCRIGAGTRPVESREIEPHFGISPNDAGTPQLGVDAELS